MSDLERAIRDLLDDEARSAPEPHDARSALRQTRRRQGAVVAGGALAAIAVIAVSIVGLRAIGRADDPTFADEPTTTSTLNGISITHPETWHVLDPDELGMNGTHPTPGLPRLVVVLSPIARGELLACPGIVEGSAAPTFVMTIQEQPLALTGDAARAWPVELEPLEMALGGTVGAGAVGTDASTGGGATVIADSGCYPGWTFLQARWTAAGRTFQAAVGLAPDVADEDRSAVLDAFASMTFDPGDGGPSAAVLDQGEIGGETWELVASRDDAGLTLSLNTEGSSAGIGGFSEGTRNLQFGELVVGEGDEARLLVFGAVPPGTAKIECPDPAGLRTLDVPDAVDDRFEAFLAELDVGLQVEISALDADGNVIASGVAGSNANPDDPVLSPTGQAPLEDGRHFGFVRAVHPAEGTIEFDPAIWLTGREADQAYEEATGETGGAPNDHYVVNDDTRLRELPLSPDLELVLLDWSECCDTFFRGEIGPFAQAIEERTDVLVDDVVRKDDVIYRGVSLWWITVEDGVVTRIEEQYAP